MSINKILEDGPAQVNFVKDLLKAGSIKSKIDDIKISKFINYTDACIRYGKTNVNNWSKWGLIQILQDGIGRVKRIDFETIEAVSLVSNRGF